ncbi:hypothetical protein PILCRDRAFT_811016 [Piloderma croceum F 1598]|uniref:CHAT domain-containing protein n=1 Tax=Piloderma croceum (strain F 1598) TaxID=765440 RepID=A0A0C3GMI8_PILCF|nr:hypothetical protein PILCRDRAFT_811016 [Piloderma croceum F 1598]
MAVKLTDDQDAEKPGFLSNLGGSLRIRFESLGELPDIESAILNQQRAVDLIDDGNPHKQIVLSNLGASQLRRFERLGIHSDLDDAISNQLLAVKLTPDGHPAKPGNLSALSSSQNIRFQRLNNFVDLESSISNGQIAVDLTDDCDPEKPNFLSVLGCNQRVSFVNLGKVFDLECAISNQQKAVELTDDAHPNNPAHLINLGNSQYRRWQKLGELTDIAACVSTFKAAAQSKAAYAHHALYSARRWADISRRHGDLVSALEGYHTALEILPKVAWLGLDVSSHHDRLLNERSENLGCLAANCAIQLGHLEEAVELLDLGRSVFWQQASSLRCDVEALRREQPELANELESVGRRLDAGNFSGSFFTADEQNVRVHSTEDIGKERRHLVVMWENLVERVRQLPQFEYFLKPIPFRNLRRAATTGQVVIINVCEVGVDALIFGALGPIDHVPLPKINLKTLTKLSSNVMLNRSSDARATLDDRAMKRHKSSTDTLQTTLQTIWHMILVPIFLQMQIPLESYAGLPQCRIWWYPTGPLTFVPLHAAGPGNETVDVGHIIISSYVTTLSNLFQAWTASTPASTRQLKLLAISQPDTPGQRAIPKSTQEVQRVIEAARSAGWAQEDIVHLHGIDASVDCVSDALETCAWVHFACHGSQDPIMGTKSAFALHDGQLELGQIASKRLSGQFAFLSACHAASGLKELPGEAMHLAAGLQFAGFPSVIATMWGISDEDAPKVADHAYHYLFRNGVEGLDPSDAATALNRAVLRLREDPDVTLNRWAPFIHFGI